MGFFFFQVGQKERVSKRTLSSGPLLQSGGKYILTPTSKNLKPKILRTGSSEKLKEPATPLIPNQVI